ncbi:MAG TPA: endolytic transglycosylase MltG, partial [Synergistales bacterium]|nr:endolytic transglycosylase MltG [Synergistales bacterium]
MGTKRRGRWKTAATLVAAVVILGGAALAGYAFLPVRDEGAQALLVEIPRGTGFLQAVEILDQAGLVTNKPFFYALAVAKGAVRAIRSGEYEFTGGVTPLEILDALVQGKVKHYLVTFPEDITARDMAARLAALRLVQEEEFLALTRDRAFLASLSIEGDTAEGYLYPETYRLERTMGAREIMAVMVRQFWKVVTPEDRRRARELGMTLGQVVTLASLIGRETGHTEEKPKISAVFHNRLRLGMKLQSDPTAVYPLKGFSGPVRKRHLLEDHPYNTYRISGLPPGP